MNDLPRPLTFLHCGFWGSIVTFGLAVGADPPFATSDAPVLPSAVANILVALFCMFAFIYWVALGVLAQRTGRNWVLWVALGLVTLAIGFIGSYILMATRVRGEIARTA